MLRAVDRVEVLTLQDNYINITAADNSDMITRARKLLKGVIGPSITAEHGFSTVVTTSAGDVQRSLLFDFGLSSQGAAENARTLGVDLSRIEAMALSHGHYDHFGGFDELASRLGRPGIPLTVHPAAFRNPRYLKDQSGMKVPMPALSRERVERAGIKIQETSKPLKILNDTVLFLGEIERVADFEQGLPGAYYEENGVAHRDHHEDDTSIALHLKGRGLVIVTGCAHAGIVNTVLYARKITGIDKIHAVMGGFHLTGSMSDPLLPATTDALKTLNPDYIAPCHCCSRDAQAVLEREMPGRFILNMSGTRIRFVS
ncbi:MAG: MBL fold metallo-hydrolase [Deltaproteobacteria bacterium]|nr:MBL fold metallo-hydrolase [Deltaproteobacteria bacterium]